MTEPARYRHTVPNLTTMVRSAAQDALNVRARGHAYAGRLAAQLGYLGPVEPGGFVSLGAPQAWAVGFARESGFDGHMNRRHRRWLGALDKPTTNAHG